MLRKRRRHNTFVMLKDYEKCHDTHIFTTSASLPEQFTKPLLTCQLLFIIVCNL